ncbi:MAG: pyridoxal kinase [Hyphomonadaceae bacterium]|nr:pyridoxal kinase [Hyphomonadaceae bacterium]GIK49172.1 MAG: pyridoxal kinase PdxY [Alphaproteobacteria bacterium]
MNTILSIQSQVAGARVGNSVAAFAMERLGVRVMQLPTVLLGRRPDHGPPGGGVIAAEMLASMIEALAADSLLGEVDAVLTGYVGAADQAPVILDCVARVKAANPKAIFVCDPVLGDEGRTYVKDAVAEAVLNSLCARADWLTPNLYELGLITGAPLDGLAAARDAAKRIGKPVLCSSIRTALGLGNLLAAPTGDWFCETPRLPRAPKGTGDLLSALYVARRVRGDALAIALEGATGAVYDIIVRSMAAESEDLLLPEAQDVLNDPVTWPRARFTELA